MTRRRAILTVVIAAFLAVLSAWIILRPNETAVYAAVLAPVAQYRPMLASKPNLCDAPAHMAGVSDALLSSYRKANAPGTRPLPLVGLRWQYDTVRLEKINPDLMFLARAKGHPILKLSRVGFSADGREALLCIESTGGSDYFLLRYAHDGWKVVETEPGAMT
jgi:hypothetical protein